VFKITIAVITGIIGLGVKTVASARDQAKWIRTADANAHHELDQFDPIATAVASGTTNFTQLNRQLEFLQKVQINPATENNRRLIPQIVNVITSVNNFLGKEGDPEPGVLSKIGLRSLIWYVDGIRDDKSYYLLDGAQLWADLRIKILQKHLDPSPTTPVISELIQGLGKVQTKTIHVRDQLDGMAQIFVAGIKRIHGWTGDIGGNLVQLRKVAQELKVASDQKQDFLDNTDDLEKETADLVNRFKMQ